MKPDLSLRVNIFLVAAVVILLGQAVYSYFNITSFKASYIKTVQDKCKRVGRFLQDDIQFILDLGVPLENIARLEQTLSDTLQDIPQAQFIEVTDAQGNLLYWAGRRDKKHFQPGQKSSVFEAKPYAQSLRDMGLSPKETDLSLPLKGQAAPLGSINIHISGRAIQGKVRQILGDTLTVMLTSLLVAFEFLTFFVAYYIQHPMSILRRNIGWRLQDLSLVHPEKYAGLGEIADVARHYNGIVQCLSGRLGNTVGKELFAGLQSRLRSAWVRQEAAEHAVSETLNSDREAHPGRPPLGQEDQERLHSCLQDSRASLRRLQDRLGLTRGPLSQHIGPQSDAIPYALIRPLIFVFIMADGFSLSFFPLYVDTLYEPVWGLSREMVLSLPMVSFMLVLALTMPLAGSLSDSRGWGRPMILGFVLNIAGHLLTALAQDTAQLIAVRCLTAAGFGLVFMGGQHFVINNTSVRSRAMGMSGFLAAFFSGDICGTVIGAMLAERIGYAPVFYLSAIFSGLALIFMLAVFRGRFAPPRPKQTAMGRMPFKAGQLTRVFRDREFSALIWLQAIPAKMALVGFLFFFVPLYLNSIDALQSNIGRVIMCYSICLIFMGPFISRIFPQEWLRKYLVAFGGLITAGAMLSFLFFNGFFPILIIVLLLGIAQSFSVSFQASIVSETEAVKTMGPGAGMGVYRFWERTGNVIGPLLMGILISWLGYTYAVVTLGAFILGCTLLYLGISLWLGPTKRLSL